VSRFTRESVEAWFPVETSEWNEEGSRSYSYGPLDSALGQNVVTVTDKDYQGTTRILLKGDDGRYAFYSYSWGSCSGCDFAEGCGSVDEFVEYANRAWDELKWMDSKDAAAFAQGKIDEDDKRDQMEAWMRDENELEFYKQCVAALVGNP
jgi:hypothetical protein